MLPFGAFLSSQIPKKREERFKPLQTYLSRQTKEPWALLPPLHNSL